MAGFDSVLSTLRQTEQELRKQLNGIQNAIAALSGGSTGRRGRRPGTATTGRKRRRFSAATRKKMAAAQKARWAKLKGAKS